MYRSQQQHMFKFRFGLEILFVKSNEIQKKTFWKISLQELVLKKDSDHTFTNFQKINSFTCCALLPLPEKLKLTAS